MSSSQKSTTSRSSQPTTDKNESDLDQPVSFFNLISDLESIINATSTQGKRYLPIILKNKAVKLIKAIVQYVEAQEQNPTDNHTTIIQPEDINSISITDQYDNHMTIINENYQEIKDKLEIIIEGQKRQEEMMITTTTKPLYSEVVRDTKIKPPPIIIRKKDNENTDIILKKLEEVNVKELGRIEKLYKNKDLIELKTNSETNQNKIINNLKSRGFNYEIKKPRKTKVLLFNVPEAYTEEEVIENLAETFEVEDSIDDIELIRKTTNKKNNLYNTYLIAAPYHLAKKFIDRGYLFHGVFKINIEKKLTTIRCNFCQRFGHNEANCQHPPSCANCGENHKTSTCTVEEYNCVNCSHYNKKSKFKLSTDHRACDNICE